MPDRLSRGDQRLLVGAVLVALSMATATIVFAPAAKQRGYGPPTTYSSGPGGALAAYLTLQELHYPVQRWLQSPTALAQIDPARSILVLAEPADAPVRPEQHAVLEFVRHGGRVLFCGYAIKLFFPSASVGMNVPQADEFSPDLPSGFTRGAWRIQMNAGSAWKNLKPNQISLYGNEKPVAVLWKLGEGEILWWAAATPLTNSGLNKQDNLVLFLNAMSASASQPQRQILWDEYFHDGRGSLWSYIARTPVKWGVLQCILLAAAILFTYSRRWGPVLTPRGETRLSPLEFVDTLGGVYRNAKATAVAVGVPYRHLRLALARALALPVNTPDETLAQAASQRIGWDLSHVSGVLSHASDAQTRNQSPVELLPLTQELARYSNRLNVSRQNSSERH